MIFSYCCYRKGYNRMFGKRTQNSIPVGPVICNTQHICQNTGNVPMINRKMFIILAPEYNVPPQIQPQIEPVFQSMPQF